MCTHSIQFDPAERPDDVRGHLRGGRLPQRGRRRVVDACEQGHRRRLQPGRPVPRGRPVRAQGARPPGEDRPPLAAEPLRRLPHRRPRRELGAAGGQRPAEQLRLSDRHPPPRSGHGLRDPGGLGARLGRARSAAATGSRRAAGSASTAPRTAAAAGSWPRTGCRSRRGSRCCARECRPIGSTRSGSTSARRAARSSSPRTRATSGSRRRGTCRRCCRSNRRVVTVLLPGLLADQAGGRKEFELEAPTVGAALRALPVRDLLFDERERAASARERLRRRGGHPRQERRRHRAQRRRGDQGRRSDRRRLAQQTRLDLSGHAWTIPTSRIVR